MPFVVNRCDPSPVRSDGSGCAAGDGGLRRSGTSAAHHCRSPRRRAVIGPPKEALAADSAPFHGRRTSSAGRRGTERRLSARFRRTSASTRKTSAHFRATSARLGRLVRTSLPKETSPPRSLTKGDLPEWLHSKALAEAARRERSGFPASSARGRARVAQNAHLLHKTAHESPPPAHMAPATPYRDSILTLLLNRTPIVGPK